jgi:Family of unknown function (DUF5686)
MVLKKIIIVFFLFVSLILQGQEKTNVADSIIKKVIVEKHKNKPNNLEFIAYNKLIISANPDSISGRIDSVFVTKKSKRIFSKIDSSDYDFKKIINKQHLYQVEKISRFQFANQDSKETILATRMAGFNQPVFEYFSLQLQPYNLYENYYTIVEKEYINPISIKGIKKYNYLFIETSSIQNRKVYKIFFKTKEKNKTNKLEGTFYIDAQNYSIARAEFKISGILNINSYHEFTFNKDLGNWFSTKKMLSIKKGKSKYPIKIFGETITFEGSQDQSEQNNKKFATDFVEINSSTKYFEAKFNLDTKISHPDIAIKINQSAILKKENSWYKYFNDTTDVRSNPTYVSLDSLAQKRKIEKKILIGRKVIKGFYPVGIFDLDMRYIIKLNNYEGVRLGLGGTTNEKLSKNFRIEGYIAYGTKDRDFKGSLGGLYRLRKLSETWIGYSYTDDLKEIASTSFEVDKRNFKLYDPRPINISTFYNHVTWKAFLETKIIPKTQSIFQISQSDIIPKFDYEFNYNGNLYTSYKTTMATASFQWNPFSKFMQTPNQKIEIESNFPKFSFQFSKAISSLFNNSFDFGKIDFRFDYQKKLNSNHKLLFLFEGGYGFGDIPITHVYNHSPNNLNKDKILQRVTFAGKDSFETMYFNEFFSDKYLFLQAKYEFSKFKISRRIKPVFSIVTRYGCGELDNPNKHIGIDYKTLQNGYLESGFEMDQIYRGLGFTAFYRYGANHLSDLQDNIAIKISYILNLGF